MATSVPEQVAERKGSWSSQQGMGLCSRLLGHYGLSSRPAKGGEDLRMMRKNALMSTYYVPVSCNVKNGDDEYHLDPLFRSIYWSSQLRNFSHPHLDLALAHTSNLLKFRTLLSQTEAEGIQLERQFQGAGALYWHY